MWPCRPIPCIRNQTTEKQGETEMRLKLLSPGEMSADQKQTYDESIAGKRGTPPAWARYCASTPYFPQSFPKSPSW
jgi:hypothetical protein